MATADQIATLRAFVGEPDDTDGWDDDKISAFIDGADSLTAAAANVWASKAATYAALVDVSESGSSRKLGDLHKNALAMGAYYRAATGGGASVQDAPVVSRIRRGF